jgi:hypothetical protein
VHTPSGRRGAARTQRGDVGPVPFDVVQACLAGVVTEDGPPARGHVHPGRPQGVLLFVVDQHPERTVRIVEWVHGTPSGVLAATLSVQTHWNLSPFHATVRVVDSGEMSVAPAKLEEWMRLYYHKVDHDIGSSGVRDLTMAEFRRVGRFALDQLDPMVFHDSECFGGAALRSVLADRWTGGAVDRMMVTHGSSEAIYIVMHTVLQPGDEIVGVDPTYQQLYDIAAALGCRVTCTPEWPYCATTSLSTSPRYWSSSPSRPSAVRTASSGCSASTPPATSRCCRTGRGAGGATAFVEFPSHPDMTSLCRRLAEQHRVLLVPGECFGDAVAGFARLGFGGTRTELLTGLAAVRHELAD